MSDETCRRRPHSTWTRCTCGPCRKEQARLDKHRKAGYYRRVDWRPAWALVQAELDAGWSPAAIADAHGVHVRIIQEAAGRYSQGQPPRQFGNRIAAQILKPCRTPTRGFVPSIGSTRRLQALGVLGWTLMEVRARTGITASVLADCQVGKRTTIAADDARLIAEIYEPLSARRGPSTRATFRARKHGWVAPLAWDEGALDDPEAKPRGASSETGRPPTRKIADLREQGKDVKEIADALGMTVERVQWVLARGEREAAA